MLLSCAADLSPVLEVLRSSRTPQEVALVSGVWPLLMHVTYNMPGQLTEDQVSPGLCNSPLAHSHATSCTSVARSDLQGFVWLYTRLKPDTVWELTWDCHVI